MAHLNRFDAKFGETLISTAPDAPAVYLYRDEAGVVIYVGKSKNIRRRLQNYRNASRRKEHRKMRTLVREAHALEIILQVSERGALLLENKLIQELRPRFNYEGTWTFLYPAIGIGENPRQALFCLTTDTAAWSELGLDWYGVFRSRVQAREAFESLIWLLKLLGHVERAAHLPKHVRLRGSWLVGIRRLPEGILRAVTQFMAGESREALVPLVEQMLEMPGARKNAPLVQEHLKVLLRFHRRQLVPLRSALMAGGRSGHFVHQDERDALFLDIDDEDE